ncbi:MAG: phenylalanine--tRNA ligase subunit beta [Neomegalonema sp.]|nr:phenylalanine--tRNA ligase subunit beta [Neomegalonema sp.]
MKFTLSWLKDHLDTNASLDAILAALTDLGLEVEGVENLGDALASFRICKIVEAKQHPNADKLRVCRVEHWPNGPESKSETIQVVCGAPNARTGLVGVLGRPGDYVPGLDITLKEGEIRGEKSMGMLCSASELTVSDDHEGILDLPEDAPLGARYVDYAGLDDPVIEIAITPNRPDACGVVGVARDLAARALFEPEMGKLKPIAVAPHAGQFPCPVQVALDPAVRKEDENSAPACPHFAGRLIRNVKNGPSPDWMGQRMKASGLNVINALVDVTNYVAFDRARPLHVFDANKLDGNIKVRFAKSGETLEALDGKTYALDETMTVICDKGGRRVVAIAGVMGGLATGCDETTTDVFIESAYFDPIRTAATGRKLNIVSDARYRFERGVDPEFTESGVELATKFILENCGGEPSERVVAGKVAKSGRNGVDRKFKLRPERVGALVGMEIDRDRQAAILEALGFTVGNPKVKQWNVTVPPWRPDVHGEADLVEEIARVASLTKLAAQPLAREPGVAEAAISPLRRRAERARRTMAALGLNECVSYSFISDAEAAAFGGDAALRLENPIAADKSDMRPSLLPGLLAAAARNQARGFGDVALFEVGPEFFGPEPGEQREVATSIRVGAVAPRDWSGARRSVDLYDAKADAEAALAAIGAPVEKLMIDRETSPWMHPGRSARLKLGPKNVLAEFGELHPKTLKLMDVKGPAVAAVVYLEAAPASKAKSKARAALTLHDLQSVERDFAFVVDAKIEAAAILRAAKSAEKKLITSASVFDVFEGPKAAAQLGDGKKSVAISVTLQPTQATLTDEDIEAVSTKVVEAVKKAVDAELRS